MKTWLITGCSSGFGKNLAETLLSEGEQVVVTYMVKTDNAASYTALLNQ